MDESEEYLPQNSMLDYSLMDTGGGPPPGYDTQAGDPYGMMRPTGAGPAGGATSLQAMNNMMPPQMHPAHPYGHQGPPQPPPAVPAAPAPKTKGRRGKKAQQQEAAAAAAAAAAHTPQNPYGNPYGSEMYGQPQQAGPPGGGGPQNPMHAMAAMSQNPMMARQRYPPPHAQQMPPDPYAQQQAAQQGWYPQQQQAQQQYPPPYRPQYPQQQGYPGAPGQGYYPQQQQPQRPYYPPQQQQYGGPRYPAPQQNPYGGYPMDQQQQQTSGYGYPGQKPPSGYPTADWQGQQAQQQQNSQATSQQPQRPSYPPHAQQQQQMYSLQTEIQTAEAQLKSLHERGPPMDPQGREYIHSLQQRIHYMRQQLQQMQQAAAASQQQQHQMATPPMYPQGSQQSHQTQQSQVSQHQPPTPHQAPTPQQQMASTSDQPVSVMQTTANQVQVNITPTPETSGRTLISVYHQYNSNPAVQTNSAMPSGTVSSPGKDSIPPEPTPSKIEPPLSQPPQQSQMMTPPQYASVQQTQVAPATSSGQPPTPEFTYNQQTKPSSSTSTIAAIEQSEETQEPQQPYSEPAGVVESSTGDDVVVSSGDVTGSPQNLTNGDDEEGPSSSYSPDQAKADESDRQSADEMRDDDEEEDQEDGRQSLGPLDADSSDIPPESENPILDDEPSAQSMASQSSQNDEPSPEPSMTIEVPIEDESSMASESMDAPPSERTINEDEEESNMSQPVPEIVVQEAPAQDFPAMNFAPTKKRGGGSRKKSVGGPAAKKRKKAVSDEEDFLDDEDRDYVVETSKRSKKKAKAKAAIQQELPLEQEYPVEYIEKRRSTRKRGTQHSYKEKHDLDQEELAELLLPSSSNDRRSKSRTIDDSRASTADGGELTPMPNDDGDSMAPSEVPSELLAPLPSEWVVEKILGVRIREKKPIVKEEPKKIENEAEKNEAQLKHEAPEVNGQKKGADEAMETDKPGTSAEMKPEASPDGTDVSTLPTEASSSSTSTVPTPSIMEEEEDAEEFLIKFKNKSYLHCEWHTMAELEHLDKRAAGKITRFKTKQANLPFQTDEDEYFNEDFTVVERVLDEVIEENGDHYFFVKWRSLSYEECTWELAEIVPEERVQEFRERNEIVDPAKAKEKSRPSEREWTKLHPEKTYKDGNKLREYQFIGVDWLLFCYYNKKNCILADEMGLGKTVQTITFLQGVYDYGIHGPFLVVVPLSTLHNWEREFETWTNMNAVVYHGGAQSRQIIQQYELYYQNADSAKKRNVHKFDALITTFEMVVSDCEVLKRIPFRVCVIDEAHRLKNRNCKLLTGGLLSFKMEHRVLLTGTPLQNNIHELFSLLNFLEPLQFHSSEQFLEKFGDCKTEEQVQMLQEILKPMMLRRLKEDVEKSLQPKEETIIEVQLSNAQKKYYRAILERNFTHLCKGTSAPSLMNTMMELRKCCNHPFLINGAEETILGEMKLTTNFKSDDELLHYALIQSSGKLVLIDKLLPKLRKDGHKVLIFSQMVRVLDILEEFLVNMNYPFERIDGNVRGDMRQAAIDRFSKPDSDRFVFLLCTRAGGLGINLTAADTVIIFDSDWNPQNDLQAQARCHRIGQKKMVKVYRLITSNTYEREMFDKASLKLGLDKAVLQSMAPRGDSNQLSRKEVEQLLKKGAYGAIMDEDTEGSKFNEEDIDTILQRRTHTITLEAGIKGSTFAKATFNSSNNREDIDVNDPNFWAKWAKKANIDTEIGTDKELIMLEPRNRRKRFEENKNDEEGSDGDNTDSEQGSTKNGRGKSTRASMMNGGRKRRRGHDDDDDDYVSYTPDELAFNKSEFFKVEKLVAMWGWGRWSVLKEQIDSNLSENDIEHIARTLLLHCIREYRGDEKTREFVWKLITPAGGLVGKGGYMPAPAGRKGQINTIYQEGWAALPEYNPPAFAVDSSFQRHVHRHANKLLSRVHHLQILGSQITGGDAIEDAPVLKKEERKEEEKELLKEAKESEPKEAEAKEEEPKEKAGEAEAKEALEADGKPKENSEAEAAAPKTSEELPKINGDIKEEHKDSEAEKAFEEAVLTEPKAAENGESLKVKSEADSTEEPSIEKPAEVEENDKEAKEVEEAPDLEEKPAKLQKEGEEPGEKMDAEENRSQKSEEEPRKVKRTPYDIANVPMIADPMMPIADWDINCDKHLLIGIWKHGAENYEAIFTDPELCFCKKQWSDFPTVGDLNGRFKRLIAMYQRAIEAAIAAAQQMAVQQQPLGKAYRWPKRDEQEFIRVLRIYGVKDDTNTTNIINWSRFKELSPILTKKSDSELLEELYCVLAMCTKQQGGELSVVDQRRASMVDLLPKMKAEKLMNRLHLMRKIHAIITTGIQSIKTTLRLCSTEAMPNGWNEEQDEMLLTVVDKFGLDNISVNVARVPAFQKIIRPEEKTLLRRVIEICTTLESGKWNGPASTEMIDDGPDTEDIGALFQGMQNSLNSSAETLRGSTPTSSSTRRGRKRGANAVDPIEAEKEKMRVMMHQNYLRSQMDQSSYSQAISALITQQMMLPLLSGQLGGSSSSTASQAQQIQQLFNFAAAAALATPQVPAASTSKSKPTGSEIGLNLSTKEAASNSATAAQTPKQSAPSTPAPAPAAVSSKPSTSSSDIDYSDLLKKAGFPGDTRVPIFCEEDGSRLTGDKAPTVNSLSLYLAANPKYKIDFNGLSADKPSTSGTSLKAKEEPTPSTSSAPAIKRAAPSPALEPGEIPRSSSTSKPSTSGTSSSVSNAPVAVYHKKNGLMLAANKCPPLKTLAAWLDKHPDYNVHSSSVTAAAAILPKMYQERLGGENNIAVSSAASTSAASNSAAAAASAALLSGLNPSAATAADLQMQLLLQQTMMSQALYGPYAALLQQPSLAAAAVQATPTSATSSSASSASQKDHNQLLLELMSNPLLAASMLQANTMNPQAQMLNQLLTLDLATAAAAAAAAQATTTSADAAGASKKSSAASASSKNSRGINAVLQKLANP